MRPVEAPYHSNSLFIKSDVCQQYDCAKIHWEQRNECQIFKMLCNVIISEDM